MGTSRSTTETRPGKDDVRCENEVHVMAELLVDNPDLRVFWTSFDPLDLASDSIDPLGFMAGYIALADRILPGLTTITNVPRYAGMLCLALRFARDAVGDDHGHGASARRRAIVEKLKLFERAWALACGFAEREQSIGVKATDGLRGVRAVHKWRDMHAQKERVTLAFDLLSNQVRYGGIGAYSTFLESMHLADMGTLTLRPLGEELADAFPSPADFGLDVLREDVRLSVEAMRQWGCEAHTGTLSTTEAQVFRRALQGGEETEFDDVTRWTMLRLIRRCDAQEQNKEPRLLAQCLSALKQSDRDGLKADAAASDRIRAALRVIEPYERLFQCTAFVFDQVRCGATGNGQANLRSVMKDESLVQACAEMRLACSEFVACLEDAESAPGGKDLRQDLQKLGLTDLAQTLGSASESPIEVGREVIRRHQRVQEGKFDGGFPKGPWIRVEPGQPDVAQLTSQRFGLDGVKVPDSWESMPRHPYRTFGARRFIKLCKIS